MDYPGHAKKLEAENAELHTQLEWALSWIANMTNNGAKLGPSNQQAYHEAKRALLAKSGGAK